LCRPSAPSQRIHLKLGVTRGWIQLSAELPFREQPLLQLSGGAHQLAGGEMATDYGAAGIGEGDLQGGTIG
jgi:hypothetical protein